MLRSTYFRSIVRQNIAYFDVNDTGEMNTRLFDDVKKIQDSIAEKVGVAIQENFLQFFSCIFNFFPFLSKIWFFEEIKV